MKKLNAKRLSLDTSTVRSLTTSRLSDAAGGWWNDSEACATGRKGCSGRCDSQVQLGCYTEYSSFCK